MISKYVQHYDGIDNPLTKGKTEYDIYPDLAYLPNEKIFEKKVNSCF